MLDLTGWPAGMRVIVRAERPHPGAQLRFTELDGNRLTAFATNTRRGQLADLELRHRRRARCEDRIRCAKDTGLTNLPQHDFDQNRIWLAIVMLAATRPAWLQLIALHGTETPTPTPAAIFRRSTLPTSPPTTTRPRTLGHLITAAINKLNPAPT